MELIKYHRMMYSEEKPRWITGSIFATQGFLCTIETWSAPFYSVEWRMESVKDTPMMQVSAGRYGIFKRSLAETGWYRAPLAAWREDDSFLKRSMIYVVED